jgi:hypothetical protein
MRLCAIPHEGASIFKLSFSDRSKEGIHHEPCAVSATSRISACLRKECGVDSVHAWWVLLSSLDATKETLNLPGCFGTGIGLLFCEPNKGKINAMPTKKIDHVAFFLYIFLW